MKGIFRKIRSLFPLQTNPESLGTKRLDRIREDQLKNNVIDLSGDVEDEMAQYVRQCISFLAGKGNPDIEVWITSSGGKVDVGLHIYDMLRLYPGKKSGRVIAFADSMAMVILQACDTRAAPMHARIGIHHIGSSFVKLDVLRDPAQLKQLIDGIEKDQEQINGILSQRTKQTADTIRATCEQDRPMTAEQALAFGLIDTII